MRKQSVIQISPQNVAASDNGSAQRIRGLVQELPGQVRRWSQWKIQQYRTAPQNPTIVQGVSELGYPNPFVSIGYKMLNYPTDERVPTLPFSGATVTLLPYRPPDLSKFDVVQVEFPWQYRFIESRVPDSTTLVYSSHNVEFKRLSAMAESAIVERIARYTRRIERHAVETADLVVTTSEADRRTYERNFEPNGDVEVVPNGASDPGKWTPPNVEDGLDAVFVGSDYPPNVEAVKALIADAEELPPSVTVHIVGTVSRGIAEKPPENFVFHGFVDELDEFLTTCDVALNPVTSGGGSNVKLPKYLSHGLATISTPFGARGFDVVDETDCLVVDTQSFKNVLEQLASGAYNLVELGRNARSLFDEKYSWKAISERHGELVSELSSVDGEYGGNA